MAKILIIDDDKMVRETLRLILAAAGHQILLANDGKQGVKMFIETMPDLVITDILMPEKEGVETIGDIRKLKAKVPIIAMSGGGRVGNMSFLAVAKQFGADRTFAKPFEPDEVVDAVTELLKAAA
jgi:two-component system, chemotaxis family, chemotaxis protein CheY